MEWLDTTCLMTSSCVPRMRRAVTGLGRSHSARPSSPAAWGRRPSGARFTPLSAGRSCCGLRPATRPTAARFAPLRSQRSSTPGASTQHGSRQRRGSLLLVRPAMGPAASNARHARGAVAFGAKAVAEVVRSPGSAVRRPALRAVAAATRSATGARPVALRVSHAAPEGSSVRGSRSTSGRNSRSVSRRATPPRAFTPMSMRRRTSTSNQIAGPTNSSRTPFSPT